MSLTHPATTPVEAPLSESKLEQFLDRNFKAIMLGLVLLAVVLLALGVKRYFSHQTEVQAAEKFTDADSVEDCDFVIQKYPGSLAAGNAMLIKAGLLWTQGKKESSVDVLKQFVKDDNSHTLHPQALLALASKQAALGENDAARQTCETLIKTYPKSEMAAAADIQLGDLLWQEGKIDEAKKLFESLPPKYPNNMSAFFDSVTQRLELMAAGLPMKEVDGPPPAPKPATPAANDPDAELKKKIMEALPGNLQLAPSIEVKPTPGPEVLNPPVAPPLPVPAPTPQEPAKENP